jgi:Domain of unknown function (DUF4844)
MLLFHYSINCAVPYFSGDRGVSVFHMKLSILVFTILTLIGCGDGGVKNLPKGNEILSALETLKDTPKFSEDLSQFYPGAPNEEIRVKAEQILNTAISDLMAISNKDASEKEFWSILESAARKLALMDSEEMDRGLAYMESIMDIYNIESSEGRLNRWRYGFDPQ